MIYPDIEYPGPTLPDYDEPWCELQLAIEKSIKDLMIAHGWPEDSSFSGLEQFAIDFTQVNIEVDYDVWREEPDPNRPNPCKHKETPNDGPRSDEG